MFKVILYVLYLMCNYFHILKSIFRILLKPLLLLKQHSGCSLGVHRRTQSTHSQALPILHLL